MTTYEDEFARRSAANRFSHVPGDPQPVEIRPVLSPDGSGDLSVLIQLVHGFIIVPPASARRIAELILSAAAEADASWGGP